MFKNLYVRLLFITCLILVSLWVLNNFELKKGIDLAGGVDLVYELDLSRVGGAESGEMANRVIETLKRRVDPNGVRNLTWRVAGGKRIEIQMPLANEATRDARKEFRAALDALAATNLRPAALNVALNKQGAERAAALNQLAPVGNPRRALLDEVVKTFDEKDVTETAARKQMEKGKLNEEMIAKVTASRDAYKLALSKLMDSNIDLVWLTEKLEQLDDPENKTAQKELDELVKSRPGQADLIKKVYAANDTLRLHRTGGFDDPADLQRLLKGAGVLDFRICVARGDDGYQSIADQAREQFANVGPLKTKVPNVAWFEIDPKNGSDLGKRSGYEVEQSSDGKSYILLYTDPARSLTHDESHGQWKLADARVGNDPMSGKPIVHFAFDNSGGNYFATLTGSNVGHTMAILLDGRAITAPNIRTAITGGSGQIDFGGSQSPAKTLEEAKNLVQMLDAGSLPATLQPEPISVQTISSSFGKENIEAGLKSGIYAVIAVVAFMAIYYTLSGSFADVAVMINLLMLLAAMSMFRATLTLPGIAGIVLTLGMAVDSNVLINERIREEVHRGASLWMAVRLGYERVFWTIFDSHITTSLSAFVLIFVATEEVKGFGVTLLIGLAISMFTALFVTRTFMIAAVKWGILRKIDDKSVAEYIMDIVTLRWLRQGVWPYMKVITVTNINWIGMRHYFWTISAIISVVGIIAFFARGNDKYDTEFNGGTQVTFQLRPGVTMDTDQVRKRVEEMAGRLSKDPNPNISFIGKELTTGAQVQSVGEAVKGKFNQFQIVTAIADTNERKVKGLFLNYLVKEFEDVLDINPSVSFANSSQDKGQIDALIKEGTVRPINKRFLDQVITGASPKDLSQNDVTEYLGGAAVDLRDLNPPQTVGQLTQRIKSMRQQPEFTKIQYRDFKVIPLAYEAAPATQATTQGQAAATPRVTRAVVIALDPNVAFTTDTEDQWRTDVATTEWTIIRQALTQSSSLQGVTSFDPVVASTAKTRALIAILISLLLIIIYVWVRFGGIRYGLGAIFSLAHDAIVAVAATVISGVIFTNFRGFADALLIGDFKINLTMIAAYLTIIGYSVNDTIVIFDRIRENRGRARGPLSAKLINDSINQCFGRTIWTTYTVFIVVLIMYIWGGEGVRGFSFAMLIGVFTGAYSTLAIASPALLTLKERKESKGGAMVKAMTPDVKGMRDSNPSVPQ